MLKALTKNKDRLFWTLQIAGWTAFGFLHYLLVGEMSDRSGEYLIPALMYAGGGIVVTTVLRYFYRAIWRKKPAWILLAGALASLAASIVFTGFRSWIFIQYYERFEWADVALLDYFNLFDLYISLYVIGTWSALYFGIRYYREAQHQTQRLLKATSAAHEAQLKVLRYQLNPHFLFNTLNAISTLTLEGDKSTSNRLVTDLSAFLRHTLDSDPHQKVTLRKEMEMLDLYLSIEKVRFEDLLTVSRNIEPEALDALVPVMILQPLIEQAIRRSIAPAEDGGTISIAAFIEDGKLSLRVADTATGEAATAAETSEPGFGLANTRERLSVLYGDEHELRLDPLDPSGLGVAISIPFEHGKPKNAQSADRR